MQNPKIKVLKPVRWGINQPGPDVLTFTDDDVDSELVHDDVNLDLAEEMQDAGYITILDDGEEEVDGSDINAVLQALIKPISGKRKQKDALEVWGGENLKGYSLDKSKSLEDCLTDLVEAHSNLGD